MEIPQESSAHPRHWRAKNQIGVTRMGTKAEGKAMS